MKHLQARLWLLLISSLLSCPISWAQDSSAKLADFNLVLGAEPYSTRGYLLAEMDSFTTTHRLQLLITLLDQEDIYTAYARQDEDALLAQPAPALVITTWHQGEGKYYQRCEVQLNKALATRLPQATAQQLVEEMLNYYGKGDMMAQDAMNSGLTVALLKLSEYLNALPPPEATPTITFANAPAVSSQPTLGLDAFTYEVYRPHYEQVRINEEPYPVAWKALPSGGTTSVLTQVEKGVSFPPGVVFRQNGNTLSSQPATQNHQQQLTLTGQMHKQEGSLEVYASREEDAQLVGKLRTISYDVLYKRLVLVVLDDVTSDMLYLDRVSRAVQATLAQAGVSLTIEIQKFDTEWVDRDVPLEDETKGMLSNYPKELKRVIKDYRQEHEQEAETAYIFLAGSSSTGKLGYMPKKHPYGFVYRNAHYYAEEVAKTIAHELGHGLFRLEHTFEAYPTLAKGSTDNLMDYGKGTRLHKYQWDLVHDPKAMLGWFQDEEENAYYGDPYAYLWKEINELTSSINYSLYQFNQWVEESKRSILSLFDFSDVALTSDEAKVYEILTAVKEDNLESLSSYAAEEIITGQDLELGEESYEKLIVYFLQAPTAIDTKSYQVEDKTEEGYSLLIFSEEGKADEEVLRVQVASEQKKALQAYLFGEEENEIAQAFPLSQGTEQVTVELYEGNNRKGQDSILMISSVPAMPDIKAKLTSNGEEEYDIKLVIEYLRQCTGDGVGRTPNQSESFPSSGWHKLKANEEWDIDFGMDAETNRPKIRGGIAYLITKISSEQTDTLRFFIKGNNPTVAQINTYINQAPYNQIWFFKKIIFQESGSRTNLASAAKQFNTFNNNFEQIEDDWDEWSRYPNFGAPCGWGLMQLDNPAPTAQALWDWQANIIAAYELLSEEKRAIINRHLNRTSNIVTQWNVPGRNIITQNPTVDGGITYTHNRSNYFNHTINTHLGNLPANGHRSFVDACWIKSYNGIGSHHYYYLEQETPSQTPHWEIDNVAYWYQDVDGQRVRRENHYVREIGNRQVP